MKQTINAIYENGVFRPLKKPEISEGQQVELIVETAVDSTSDDLLELAAQVYQGLSAEQEMKLSKLLSTAVISLEKRLFNDCRTGCIRYRYSLGDYAAESSRNS